MYIVFWRNKKDGDSASVYATEGQSFHEVMQTMDQHETWQYSRIYRIDESKIDWSEPPVLNGGELLVAEEERKMDEAERLRDAMEDR